MIGGARCGHAVASVAVAMTLLTVATGCGSEGGSIEAYCNQVTRVPTITDRDQLSVPDPTSATTELVTELRRLRAAAPKDIRPDVTVLVEVSEQLERALTATDEQSRSDASDAVDGRRTVWKEASARVVAYTKRRCGIDLGST